MRLVRQPSPTGDRRQPPRTGGHGGASDVAAIIRRGAALTALILCGCAGHMAPPDSAALKEAGLEFLAAAYGVKQATVVAPAPGGEHYMLDAEAARIYRFAPDGTVLVLPLENEGGGWRPETLAVDDIGNLTVAGRSPQQRSVYDIGGRLLRPAPSLAGALRPASPAPL